jgi:hypothetical protein
MAQDAAKIITSIHASKRIIEAPRKPIEDKRYILVSVALANNQNRSPISIQKWKMASDRPESPSQINRGQNARITAAKSGATGLPGNNVCVIL